jgi:SAM-dependent methyltransferase
MRITSTTEPAADEQAALWNGAAGQAWVEAQQVLDGLFKPFEDQLVDAVRVASARRVLDVGCGTGATTLAIARKLGSHARCVGVDISEQMIALARQRAAGAAVEFVVADAGRHPFDPGAFDVIASRFGVMFFEQPEHAFANLRTATRDGGTLRAVVWRRPEENPFMTTAEQAADGMLALPPRNTDGPGQFAFADRGRVVDLLAAAGWSDADVAPVDVECAFPAADLDAYLGTMGPVGRALAEHDEATRARVVEHVRPAFDRFRHGDEVRFTAACWLVAAVA